MICPNKLAKNVGSEGEFLHQEVSVAVKVLNIIISRFYHA